MSGEGEIKSKWNKAIIKDVIAKCYVTLIRHLISHIFPFSGSFYDYFPSCSFPASSPWYFLVSEFYSLISSESVFYTPVKTISTFNQHEINLQHHHHRQHFIAIQQSICVDEHNDWINSAANKLTIPSVNPSISSILVSCNQPVISLPRVIQTLCQKFGASPQIASPKFISQWLTSLDMFPSQCNVRDAQFVLEENIC